MTILAKDPLGHCTEPDILTSTTGKTLELEKRSARSFSKATDWLGSSDYGRWNFPRGTKDEPRSKVMNACP